MSIEPTTDGIEVKTLGPATLRPATPAAPGPPPRPRGDHELTFTRRQPVRWFTPKVLASASQRVALSTSFGGFLDKRELQRGLPSQVVDLSKTGPDMWFDYVADTGDGFDATYSIAWLTAQPELAVEGASRSLPRPGLLVLGGDEVYPTPSSTEYDDRFRGPYRAALPYLPDDNPQMLAIPGNHDWYDGLTNFMRLFCTEGRGWVGGRTTDQTHSYFAARLPHDWWLWGIDIQFNSYIDDPQLRYFRRVACEMGRGARLILCTAEPSWTDVGADRKAFHNLAYLESQIIRPQGIDLRVSISGDSHHYARYVSQSGAQRITAGGGGAFLHPTHHLDRDLDVPCDTTGETTEPHHLETTFPRTSTSRWLSAGALRLPRTNPQFMLVPALIYLVVGWASQFANRVTSDRPNQALGDAVEQLGWFDHIVGMVRNPVSVLVLLFVIGGLIGFAKPPAGWSQGPKKQVAKVIMGGSHFAAQVAVGGLVGVVAVDLASHVGGRLHVLALALLVGGLGAVTATLVLGAYLALCCAFLRAHGNEAFSAMGLTRHKNFLRMHIDDQGLLTIYPIGIDRSNDGWIYRPDDVAEASWLAPAPGRLRPKLIERAIVVGPSPDPTDDDAAAAEAL
jgi:hypothetical protein